MSHVIQGMPAVPCRECVGGNILQRTWLLDKAVGYIAVRAKTQALIYQVKLNDASGNAKKIDHVFNELLSD